MYSLDLIKHASIPLLLLVSGFCGISYEILYTKLLGNLLGNQFTINATVLLTFLGGIGFGTLYAHRFIRHLWLIEAGIGLYAVILTLLYAPIDALIYSLLSSLGTNILASAFVAFVVLAIPSFLVGCSLPLFAAYLGESRKVNVFATTYSIYNVGGSHHGSGTRIFSTQILRPHHYDAITGITKLCCRW